MSREKERRFFKPPIIGVNTWFHFGKNHVKCGNLSLPTLVRANLAPKIITFYFNNKTVQFLFHVNVL